MNERRSCERGSRASRRATADRENRGHQRGFTFSHLIPRKNSQSSYRALSIELSGLAGLNCHFSSIRNAVPIGSCNTSNHQFSQT